MTREEFNETYKGLPPVILNLLADEISKQSLLEEEREKQRQVDKTMERSTAEHHRSSTVNRKPASDDEDADTKVITTAAAKAASDFIKEILALLEVTSHTFSVVAAMHILNIIRRVEPRSIMLCIHYFAGTTGE